MCVIHFRSWEIVEHRNLKAFTVATVLSLIVEGDSAEGEVLLKSTTISIVLGMFSPSLLSAPDRHLFSHLSLYKINTITDEIEVLNVGGA